MPALLPPLSGPRSTARAVPAQRHITPKVWHTESSAASGSARMASKSAKSGPSHDGSSAMPWAKPVTPSFRRGSRCPGPPVPR